MAVSDEFRAFAAELLGPLGPIGVRRMFGGAGVYCGDTMFALLADDTIYMKTDEASRAAYRSEGSTPFEVPKKDGRTMATSYWKLPDRLLDEAEELQTWARQALAVARNGRKAQPPAPRATRRGAAR